MITFKEFIVNKVVQNPEDPSIDPIAKTLSRNDNNKKFNTEIEVKKPQSKFPKYKIHNTNTPSTIGVGYSDPLVAYTDFIQKWNKKHIL